MAVKGLQTGLVAALLLAPALAAAGEVVFELAPVAQVSGPRLRLADLVRVESADAALRQRLEALPLGHAPLVGQLETRSRAELDLLLRGQTLALGQQIVWRGASTVKIQRSGQLLDAMQLQAAAQQFVAQRFGAGLDALETRLDGGLPDLGAPLGALQLQVRPGSVTTLRKRMPVWVDVIVQDSVYRSVLVPLLVSARRPVYVARHDMAAGSVASAADFVQQVEDVAGLADEALALEGLNPGARVRQALAAGQVATVRHIAPAGMVLQGDHVRLQAGAAGIAIESDAVAQANGVVGQHILVRPEHSKENVLARVTAPGTVSMDGR